MTTESLPAPLVRLGLSQRPFVRTPKVEALFHWPALDEAQARLSFAHQVKGFALLTGDPGSGKSTALRLFLASLEATRSPTVYLADGHLTPREFYGAVLDQFGLMAAYSQTSRRRQFITLMTEMAETQHLCPVVIIDEAHELMPEMVQELRYLQNLGLGTAEAFTLLLCGQSEIRTQLKFKAFEAVTQRITMRAHLGSLSLQEVDTFLREDLARAGVSHSLFTDQAVEIVHAKSRGLIRKAGTIAMHALLDTALNDKDLVQAENVERACLDLED